MHTPIKTWLGVTIIIIMALSAGMFIWYQQKNLAVNEQPVINYPTQNHKACTQEAKLCPDGSYVARTGPNCEFAPCPVEDKKPIPDEKKEPIKIPEEIPNNIYSCKSNSDCAIRDTYNCCGKVPQCVNKNATLPSAESVVKRCQEMGVNSICGYPSVDSCKCENNTCRGLYKGQPAQ